MSIRAPSLERQGIPGAVMIAVMGLALLAIVGFLGARARIRASAVERALDARIVLLQKEIEKAADASSRHAEILRELASLSERQASVEARFPCELDADAFLAELRASLVPLGIELRPELGWRQARGGVKELRVPLVLPARQGAEEAARAALARLGHVVLLEPRGQAPLERVAVGVAQEHCMNHPPELPRHDEPVAGRDLVEWPFDAGVREREQLLERLRQERDARSGALRDLERARLLEQQVTFAESRLAGWR